MAHPIPDEFPKTLAEWPEFIQNAYEWRKEQYAAKVAEAKANAKAQWDKELPAKREKLIAQATADINAETVATPEGPRLLTEPEKTQKLEAAMAQIVASLQAEEKQYIEMASVIPEQAPTLKGIEEEFSIGKPQSDEEKAAEQTVAEPQTEVAPYDAIWTDGTQYWDVAEACYVNPNSRAGIDQSRVVMLGGSIPFEQNIRENIKYYAQRDPRIQLGPEIMDTEELFVRLREKRSERLAEYDQKIAQLDRLIRENPDYATYSIQRAEWDTYATALCNLPTQPGAPWDGGGPETPWPAKPE